MKPKKTIILDTKDGCAVIGCEIRPKLGWGLQFYCDGCKRYHYHGEGDGWRSSHCINKNSSLYNKQYYLKLVGEKIY